LKIIRAKTMKQKTVCITLAVFLCAAAFASGQDISVRPRGYVSIPAGSGNRADSGDGRYESGGGADLGLDFDLSSLWVNGIGLGYTAGVEGGFGYASLKSPADGALRLYSGGAGLGLHYFPFSRILTRAEAALGLYQGVTEEAKSRADLWWRAGIETGFRFSPSFTLALAGGWKQYNSGSGVLHSGLYAGLGLQFTIHTGASAGAGVETRIMQEESVYPVFMELYQRNPAAAIVIRNNENAEIRDVRVSFKAADYTSSEFPCGAIALIAKGGEEELGLLADFSPQALEFTDAGRILGDVVIRYSFLGEERQTLRAASIRVSSRNTFPAGDPSGLAAFVSPSSPHILEFAKSITGLARAKRKPGMNGALQFGLWLFEGLAAAGLRVSEKSAAGEYQFPAETLGFRGGSAADAGLLYAAVLEASGIPAALIPAGDDFIVALGLGVSEEAAETLAGDPGRLVIAGEEAWIPLSMRRLGEGFAASWRTGAEKLKSLVRDGQAMDFVVLEEAWTRYPPAPLAWTGTDFELPGESAVTKRAEAAVAAYIAQEIEPLIPALQAQIRDSPSGRLYNRLGLVSLRAGRMNEAKAACERAAGMGLAAGMVNRGQIALLEKDYAAAEKWFRQALAKDPNNAVALRGLEKAAERR
jgi:hypothetical protein